MKPSLGMSMESQMSQRGMSDKRMDMNNQMSNMRDMYQDNQDMTPNMMHRNMVGQDMHGNMMGQEMSHNMMGQEMRSNMRDMHRQNQAFGPNQYFVKDDFGNYVYSYNDQQSEKSEENNGKFTKGHYAYIMSNGVKRRVEYIADNNGFHIIRDNADPARIKRSSEPDLVQAKMTSVMDSSSLRNDARDMYRMSNMMGRDMSSQMDRNMMSMDQQRYSNMVMGRNMMGQDNMGQHMMGQNTMGRNMMGRNIYNIMSNRGMTSDMSNMMSHQIMTPNMMYSNLMGQDMMDMANSQMSSKMMNSNNGLMGQRMMQQMEMERVPETYTSTRFF